MKQIIILLFSILLFSCASRKVVIEEVKKDSIAETKTKIVIVEDIKIETKKDITTDEFIITPLDTCKDIIVNGISYKNAVLTYKKVKDNSLHIEKKIVSKIEDKKEIVKTSIKEKKKEIDKKANYFIYLWFILGIVIIYVIWRNKRLLF